MSKRVLVRPTSWPVKLPVPPGIPRVVDEDPTGREPVLTYLDVVAVRSAGMHRRRRRILGSPRGNPSGPDDFKCQRPAMGQEITPIEATSTVSWKHCSPKGLRKQTEVPDGERTRRTNKANKQSERTRRTNKRTKKDQSRRHERKAVTSKTGLSGGWFTVALRWRSNCQSRMMGGKKLRPPGTETFQRV